MFKKYSLARNVIRTSPSRVGCTGTNTNIYVRNDNFKGGSFFASLKGL